MTQSTEHAAFLEDERLRLAHKRAQDMRGFYVHVMVYLCINGGLAVLDALTGGGWWFLWVAIPWGVGLASHAVALVSDRMFGAEWEQRKVDRYLRRDHASGR